MRISHEAIYQALYVQGRGALKRGAARMTEDRPGAASPKSPVATEGVGARDARGMITERPAEVRRPSGPGSRGGDLIIGLERSAIGTLIERTTRFTMLVHLPRGDGYGVISRTKNGPALAGYGAVTMKNALASTMSSLPEQLRRSLTWDRGKELSAYAAFKVDTGIPVFFADPDNPWQLGTNENTNGLLRQYFPKGTHLARWDAEEIEAAAAALNARPRKILGWKTPAEAPMNTYPLCNQPVLLRSIEPGQYTSWAFGRRLRAAGVLGSMGSIGDAYDNAMAESFFSTLQRELLDEHRWDTRRQLALAVFGWIEARYNPRRRQSSIGDLSPIDYEARLTPAAAAA